MNLNSTLVWLVRYGHVVGGAIWVGGYFLMALVIVPLLGQARSDTLIRLAMNAVRVMTYTGMATIFFGILLITRTRGFDNLLRGEWGALILLSALIAVALLGIGDGGLRPALRRLGGSNDPVMAQRTAQRFATIGLVLTIIAVGLMTRALYASS